MYTYGYNRSISSKVSHVDRYERSFKILKSVGAKSLNYDVEDKATGLVYHFVEGKTINNAKTFAGYGGVKPLKEETLDGLCEGYGGNRKKWAHRKGIAYLDIDGEEVKAEVHWFQEENVGKVKFKVKRYIDED